MAGTKGIRRTPRDLEGAVYDIQRAGDKLGQTGFMSDNRLYKSGRNAEERRNRRHKDSPNRDAGDDVKRPQSRGSSRTPREKERTTLSPRVGTIGSAPMEGRMQRKLNSSRKKESGLQTNHSSSETHESSNNKESLRTSLEGSRRAPITSRSRTKATALVVPTNDEDPKSDNVLQSEAKKVECNVNKDTGMISEGLVDKYNKVDGVLIENSSSSAVVPYGGIPSQTSLPIAKAIGTKAAGVSTGSRRNQKTQNTNKNPVPVSPFSALAEAPITDKLEGSLKTSSEITLSHETSLRSQASTESLTLWPKIQASRSEDVFHSSPIRLDRACSKDQMKQNHAIVERAKSPNTLKSAPSRTGKEEKECQDSNGKLSDRTFGISFGRKKSKNLDLLSPRSTTDSDVFSTKTKKSLKLPKLMRSLGKALTKRLMSADDNKSRKLKSTLKKAFGSRRSRSSDDGSDTASSIDMNEIQVMSPELYTTILETVASWCEEPIAEPDAESDALSARTFSSISFRNKKGREKSQDLTNFDMSATLAAEEACLDESIGENQNHSPEAESSSDSEKDTTTESDMTSILNAVDKLCLPLARQPSKKSQLITASPETTLRSQRLASFLELTDSDSEEEDELVEKMTAVNSFLHLTSSEMEPFEVKGMKEVLRMQGIWLFDWERCKEMKSLTEEWHQSSCLRKYLSGCDGFVISLEGEKVLKTYPYPVESYDHPVEKVFLDQVPQCSESNSTLKIQGTLTTKGLRTTVVCSEDSSKRQELFCLDKQGLCVQVSSELANGMTNVSKVFLKRPT